MEPWELARLPREEQLALARKELTGKGVDPETIQPLRNDRGELTGWTWVEKADPLVES